MSPPLVFHRRKNNKRMRNEEQEGEGVVRKKSKKISHQIMGNEEEEKWFTEMLVAGEEVNALLTTSATSASSSHSDSKYVQPATSASSSHSENSKYVQLEDEYAPSPFEPALNPREIVLTNLPLQTKESHVKDFFKNIDADIDSVCFTKDEEVDALLAIVTFKSSLSKPLLKQALDLSGEQMTIRNENGSKVQPVYVSRSKELNTVFVTGFDTTKTSGEITKLLRKIFSFVEIKDISLSEDKSYAYMLTSLDYGKEYEKMIDCGYIECNGARLTVRQASLKGEFKWSSSEKKKRKRKKKKKKTKGILPIS